MTTSEVAAPASPYKGLAPFEDSALDALLFFGREREIEVIVANLMASRLTVLFGASGVGKTSLLRAGVSHGLRRAHGALPLVFSSWTGDPVAELLDAVEAAAAAAARKPAAPMRRAGSLADALAGVARQLDSDIYVILDQFEEYFLYHEDERGSGTLADELPEALRRGGLRANFLLGIRDDSLARLDVLKPRIPNLFGNSLRLDRLDRNAGRAAIVGPLERYNDLVPAEERISAEPELIEALLEQVAVGRVDLGQSGRGGLDEGDAAERIEAPYLQLVLERLWEVESASGSHQLRLETLTALGGAARIVEDHLERAMAELSPDEKDAAAAIYNHLVTPSGTKIAHRARDLAGYASVGEAETARVLNRLVEERIVRAGENGAEGPRYEIFHDVLAEAVLAWRNEHEAERKLEAERATAARRHRRLLGLATGALVLIAILAVIAVYALVQRGDARSQAQRARGRELAATALTVAPVDPEQAVRDAVQAAQYERSPAVANVLRATLRGLRVKAVLPAGGQPVGGVDFSPDGRLLAVAGGDGVARIYRASDGKRLRGLRNGSPLTAAVFSPDGTKIATAAEGSAARLWDAKAGRVLHVLRHGGPVTSATFSRDGRLLATTSEDKTARIWDVATGRMLRRLDHPGGVRSASFSGDGKLLVTTLVPAAADHTGRVWDDATGVLLRRLTQPDRMTVARFEPTGPLIVTAGVGRVAHVWDARTGVEVHRLVGHSSGITDAEFSPSDRQIATASTDETARVWDTATAALVGVLTNHQNYVVRATFSPDGETVATASRDRIARIFDMDGTLRVTLVGHRESVTDIAFSSDGVSVATASADGTARLWDRRAQPDLVPLGQLRGAVTALAFSEDGRRVVSAGIDGGVRVWRVDHPHHAVATLRFPRKVTAVAISDSGRWVATAAGATQVWDTASGRSVSMIRPAKPVRALALSRDGRRLAAIGDDGRVHIWDVGTKKPLRTVGEEVVSASFSDDGGRLVTAGSDAVARIWDVASGKPITSPLAGHRAALTSASFSHDGRHVVTTSYDHDARVWDARTGHLIWTLRGSYAVISSAAFSSDDRWVVTAGPAAAGIWDMQSGRQLLAVNGHDNPLTAVALSPRGWRIVAGGAHGTVKTYDCRLCGSIDDLVAVAKQRLAGLRR
jgi:WD40 repeat protein